MIHRILPVLVALPALGVAMPATALADEALWPSGQLTYAYHGDPARGCAQMGVCDIQGVIIVRPDDEVDFSGGGGPGNLELQDEAASARVRRAGSASTGSCFDLPYDPGVGLTMTVVSGAGHSVSATLDEPPSSGRCAGPLAQDLAKLAIPGSRIGGPRGSFDLRGMVPFTAGPYSGTLDSTLTLAPMPPSPPDTTLGGGGGSVPTPPAPLVEQIHVTYRAALSPGAVGVDFSGQPAPFCAAFDACLTAGTFALRSGAARGAVDFVVERRVSHALSKREALAELTASRYTFSTDFAQGGEATTPASIDVSESFTRPGEVTCSGAAGAASGADVSAQQLMTLPRSGLPVTLATGLAGGPGSDILRTHCPGPNSGDVFGDFGVLAQATIPRRALLDRHISLTLHTSGAFANAGYAGTRSGAVHLSLSLAQVAVRAVRGEPLG